MSVTSSGLPGPNGAASMSVTAAGSAPEASQPRRRRLQQRHVRRILRGASYNVTSSGFASGGASYNVTSSGFAAGSGLAGAGVACASGSRSAASSRSRARLTFETRAWVSRERTASRS